MLISLVLEQRLSLCWSVSSEWRERERSKNGEKKERREEK